MQPRVQARFDELWRLLSSPGPNDPGPPPSARIYQGDASALMDAGVFDAGLTAPYERVGHAPFSVVEDKSTGKRRRFIAWPRMKNAADPHEAEVPLGYVTGHLGAVWGECASNLDLKAARAAFRCHLEDGTLVELARLPMGYVARPEAMQLLTSALVGAPSVAAGGCRCPSVLKVDVWIDNVRIAGPPR
ncbi:hypothetical protein NESM_000184900 [Novymonas esmeraldas]|uniref:PAS domain-containing protein n=1 Tax=Novymonas esmeraldas TaxID=1808958 RepID=A0AAW0F4P9_9TRYP